MSFRNKARYKKLVDALHNEYGDSLSFDRLIMKYKNEDLERIRIRKIYQDTFPGTSANINSMTLFSGVKRDDIAQCDMYSYRSLERKKPGCLYLGDYDASGSHKWKELRGNYDEYWNYIGCVQVPHHGSKHNFNGELIKSLNAFYVISAGLSNRYQHPHSVVMKDFLSNGIMPHMVTEMPGSAYYTYCKC